MRSSFIIAVWLLANVAAVGAYDVVAAFFLGEKETVSYWLQNWFRTWPMLAVAFGIVIGHLCWPAPVAVAKEVEKFPLFPTLS